MLATLLVDLLWRATRAAGVVDTPPAAPATAVAPTRPAAATDHSPVVATGRRAPGPLAAVAGVEPHTAASVPASSAQVLLVRGDGASAATTAVELYQREPTGWVVTARWRGHVGAKGWTSAHREGDLRTPTGTYALDDERPQGPTRGGGIWLHVDHGGPTHGCVSLPLAGLQQLMRALVPARHPVVVMGDRARLAA